MAEEAGEASAPKSWGLLEFPDARKEEVKGAFEGHGKDRLELKAVHKLLFTSTEREEYDFDTFDTDVQATCPGCGDDMSWADVARFLDENL